MNLTHQQKEDIAAAVAKVCKAQSIQGMATSLLEVELLVERLCEGRVVMFAINAMMSGDAQAYCEARSEQYALEGSSHDYR